MGQSETVVAQLCDLFLLLLAPAGGDELQGVKRGIMEMADLILVNKADGDLKPAALRTVADYAGALRLLRRRPQDPEDFPKAMPVSALEEQGLADAWTEMQALVAWRRETGHFARRRAEQARHWFEEEVREGLPRRSEPPRPCARADGAPRRRRDPRRDHPRGRRGRASDHALRPPALQSGPNIPRGCGGAKPPRGRPPPPGPRALPPAPESLDAAPLCP